MKYFRNKGYLLLTDNGESFAVLIPEKLNGHLEAKTFNPQATQRNKEIVEDLRIAVSRTKFAEALHIVMPERSERDIEFCLQMLETGRASVRQAIWVA